ncbi:MAG: thioredoxin domain-containing protein [Planctomycetota bacterium]
MRRMLPIVLLASLFFPRGVQAQKSFLGEKAPDLHIVEWVNFDGEVTLNRFVGRPVLIVYWGLRCQLCLCMPLVRQALEVHKRYAKQGLVVLGCHIHEGTLTEIDALSLKYGIDFPMGHGGYNIAYDLKQVPKAFLVNTKRIVIWEGRAVGGDFHRQLAATFRNVDYMGETKLPRPLGGVAKLVVQKKYGKAIEKLADFIVKPRVQEDQKKTAEAFKAKLEALGERDFTRGTGAFRTLDPGRGVEILERLTEEFKGHAVGRKAVLRLKEVKEDKDLAPLLEAAETYKQIRRLIRVKNLAQAVGKANLLAKKHPKASYTKMAANLLEAYDKIKNR